MSMGLAIVNLSRTVGFGFFIYSDRYSNFEICLQTITNLYIQLILKWSPWDDGESVL